MTFHKTVARTLLFALLATLLPYGWARVGIIPTSVPVERLKENAQKYIKENPKESHGYYVLGRIHSLAFAKNTETLNVRNENVNKKIANFNPFDPIMVKPEWDDVEISKEAREHLCASIENYQKATELDPKDAESFLGLAWMLQEGSNWALQFDAVPGEKKPEKELSTEEKEQIEKLIKQLATDKRQEASDKLRGYLPQAIGLLLKELENKSSQVREGIKNSLNFYWLDKALSAYRKAYNLTIEEDLKRESFFTTFPDYSISLEASQAILDILKGRKNTKEEKKEIAGIEENIKKLNSKSEFMSPIIFSLDHPKTLAELVEPTRGVYFDLDGAGARMWQWVKPDTAILVWDPEGTGKITSGLQMFGSVTWWIFWDNGYQALDLLDDNRDGWLSGDELKGLAVWFDRNGNGVCDPGEVVPVEKLGIEKIAAKATNRSEGVACNQQGIYLRNDTVLPTYDWISKRIYKTPTPVVTQK